MGRKGAIACAVLEDLYYKDSLSQREIATRLGCSESTVRRRLEKYGLPTPYRNRTDFLRRRGEFNGRCHWSPEIAYAVGLIVSDGSLSIDGRHITFTSADWDLIETFCRCLELTNRITKVPRSGNIVHSSYRVQFSDVTFYEWLLEIGLLSNKRGKLGRLNIPDVVFADFLRGWFDGDGSILTYIDRSNMCKKEEYIYRRLYIRLYSTSRKHLEWIRETLQRLLGTRGGLNRDARSAKRGGGVIWRLQYAKKDSLRLLSWMYYAADVQCLGRKRALAEPFLEGWPEI